MKKKLCLLLSTIFLNRFLIFINKLLVFIFVVLFFLFCGLLSLLITDFILSLTDNQFVIEVLSNNFTKGIFVFLPIAIILKKIIFKE